MTNMAVLEDERLSLCDPTFCVGEIASVKTTELMSYDLWRLHIDRCVVAPAKLRLAVYHMPRIREHGQAGKEMGTPIPRDHCCSILLS